MGLLGDRIRSLYHRTLVLPRISHAYKTLTTAETFSRIYATHAWGADEQQGFNSGGGSRGAVAEQYCSWLITFIREKGFRSVADLGCGDFYVGRRIAEETGIEYLGVDIVPEVIAHHAHSFACKGISFQCLDIIKDRLPSADFCVIRQVFQHLSNAEIAAALANISQYPFALVSEHVPGKPRSFNRDQSHGPHVRSTYGSGVYLDRPPFCCPILGEWESRVDAKSLIRSVLIAGTEKKLDSFATTRTSAT
jgi:SAM-dependent methyltransferase